MGSFSAKPRDWFLVGLFLLLGAAIVGVILAIVQKGQEQPGPGPPGPRAMEPGLFQDVTADSGVNFAFRNGEDYRHHYAILETVGGGIGLIDYDGDGLLDIFVTGGGYYTGPGMKTIKGHPCRLFKNLGDFKFKDVTEEAGLGKPLFYSHGVAVCDYDCDGWPDLLVTGYGRLALYRNVPNPKGGRMFVEVTREAGLLGDHFWSTSAAWADFDGDGFPDLYVCQYVDWSWKNNPRCGPFRGLPRDICPPKTFKARRHALYRNNGKGGFIDVTKEAAIAQSMGTIGFLGSPLGQGPFLAACGLDPDRPPGIRILRDDGDYGKGLGVVVVDVNGDRLPDIYVTNDTTDNFLYLNKSKPGSIHFEEVGLQMGVARDDQGWGQGSAGVDAADPFGTGWPALWHTSYEGENHALFKNLMKNGQLYFTFSAQAGGIGNIGQTWVGFGTGFLDIDNDGWQDLFISSGHVLRYPGGAAGVWQKPVLFRNNGKGRFKDISDKGGSYFKVGHRGRGVAIGDLNKDGLPDIVVSPINEPIAILKNVNPAGNNWLGVELATPDHRTVVGAKLILTVDDKKRTRFAKGGGSYLSSHDQRHIFGLGKSPKSGKLTIEWPTGEPQTEHWENLPINQYHRLVQGEGEK
jgi:hypothetical protein